VFRAAHSIKGGAGTFGFDAIAGLTHVLETLLDELRAGKRALEATPSTPCCPRWTCCAPCCAKPNTARPPTRLVAAVKARLEAVLSGQAAARGRGRRRRGRYPEAWQIGFTRRRRCS
jgi:two-component system chemotaxis sensor kinase CheA